MQHAAAHLLYSRDWRYHKELKIWMTRAGDSQPSQTHAFEQGSYIIFDVGSWSKVRERCEEWSKSLSNLSRNTLGQKINGLTL